MKVLDRAWVNCLRMWKWIAENWKPEMDVEEMKAQWLRENHFTKIVCNRCFFCKYSPGNCIRCPGKLVDPNFDCMDFSYHYFFEPKKFYQKLLKMNRKRFKKEIK